MRTANELGLTKNELKALIKTRDMLRDGCIEHSKEGVDGSPSFNMDMINYTPLYHGCGTTACIAGWMGIFMTGKKPNERGQFPREAIESSREVYDKGAAGGLHELFNPSQWDGWFRDIPAEAAVMAIDNFLETGWPNWPEVQRAIREPV